MVNLTENAAKEVKRIIEQQVKEKNTPAEAQPAKYLRLGVKGGGCSGFTYTLDVADVKSETDECWTCHGVELVCDPKSFLYLDGTTVDFQDGMMGRGFVFSNPNATGTCGCGSSFAT